ncbi:MAG: hypothetical protein WBE74_16170, partial [Terracidiphilus sp.]
MYLVCRHVKSNGLRCGSPALRGNAFCYYHSKSHSASRIGSMDNVFLPIAEDPGAIQIALSQTVQAMLAHRITTKEAGLMLYSLGVASSVLKRKRKPEPPSASVRSTTQSIEGEDLAPELCIDEKGVSHTDCGTCPNHDHCDRILESDTQPEETHTDAKVTSNYRTGRVRLDPADLIPKNEAELVKRYGSDPLIKSYFQPALEAAAEKAEG